MLTSTMEPNPSKRAVAPDAANDGGTTGHLHYSTHPEGERGSRRSMSSFERHRTSLTAPHSSFQRNTDARQDEEDELRWVVTTVGSGCYIETTAIMLPSAPAHLLPANVYNLQWRAPAVFTAGSLLMHIVHGTPTSRMPCCPTLKPF